MEELNKVLVSMFATTIPVIIEYRLALKVLGLRWSKGMTFCIMLIAHAVVGKANLYFHIAGDIGSNTLYYSMLTLGLYACLFQASIIKKLFLTALINCGFPIIFYIFLPFTHFFWGQDIESLLMVLQIFEYLNMVICAVGVEYVGKKFQNLQRELPVGYTIYLTTVIIFIHVAIYSAYDRMLIIKEGSIPLAMVLGLSMFAVLGIFIVMIAIFAVDKQVQISLREQLKSMQAHNVKSRELEWKKLAGFRHDMKNHLICLSQLLEQDRTEQAVNYMNHLTEAVEQLGSPVQTGNEYADALLSVKYAEIMEAGIKVSMEMVIPEQGYIDPVDLCCILSNAFDNAIAACCRVAEGERWIEAHAFIRQEQFIISIKNSKPMDVRIMDGTVYPKEITADHGLGLDIVKSVVQKYNGILSLKADDAFSFSVLLPRAACDES